MQCFFNTRITKRRLSTLKISQESVDGLIFGEGVGGGVGGWGGFGEVEEGDHKSSEGFQMQKSDSETENVK